MMSYLLLAIEANDAREVQSAIFGLGKLKNENGVIPDEVTDALLDILTREEIQKSELASHLLNFFEFEAPRISANAKLKCRNFLKRWGDYFNTIGGLQSVTELRHGKYLNS